MLNVEIILYNFSITLENKNAHNMQDRPQNADMYIGLENKKIIESIQGNISRVEPDIEINFNRVFIPELPKAKYDYVVHTPLNDEIKLKIDIHFYAYSHNPNLENVEQHLEQLKRKYEFDSFKINATEMD